MAALRSDENKDTYLATARVVDSLPYAYVGGRLFGTYFLNWQHGLHTWLHETPRYTQLSSLGSWMFQSSLGFQVDNDHPFGPVNSNIHCGL